MTSFRFPPPPPPPPKAPSNDAPNTYNSQRGGSSNGRGDRGRGRGVPGRGRGSFQGNGRGGPHQGDWSRGGNHRGGHRGGQQHSGRGRSWQDRGTSNGSSQEQRPYLQNSPQIPPNMNFYPSATAGYGVPPVANPPISPIQPPPLDPAALVQAMAFMSTPAGAQSMAAFASHMAGMSPAPQHTQPVPPQQPAPQDQSSPPYSSRKRKRGERAGEWQSKSTQQPPHNAQPRGQKPPRAKAAAPPPVPSFGFSLPAIPAQQTTVTAKTGAKDTLNKRRVNLGLTHLEEESDASEDEDMDEEAALAANIKVEGSVFEYNGERISLQTAAEVAAWVKDRKKNFPTQKRIAEKAQEAAIKRAGELEFLRKVAGKTKNHEAKKQGRWDDQPSKWDAKKQPASYQSSLEELREKVKESILAKQAGDPQPSAASPKQQTVDLGLGYDTESGSDDASSILSVSSVISSSEEFSDDSDMDPDDDDDSDAPPEAQSSKMVVAPITTPAPLLPPKREVTRPSSEQPRICDRWKQTGKCKNGRNCRFAHSKEEPKMVSLFERMVEQELEKADRLALEAIKYLGRNGFLG